MEILVTDRATIERGLVVRSSYVVISIHDADKPPARVKTQSGLRGVLALAFHDAEPTPTFQLPANIQPMTADHAAQICAFVNKHKNDVGAIVVHCEQGMSRSPAVAAAVSEALGLDPIRFWREYSPNAHVYHTAMEAFEKLQEPLP